MIRLGRHRTYLTDIIYGVTRQNKDCSKLQTNVKRPTPETSIIVCLPVCEGYVKARYFKVSAHGCGQVGVRGTSARG